MAIDFLNTGLGLLTGGASGIVSALGDTLFGGGAASANQNDALDLLNKYKQNQKSDYMNTNAAGQMGRGAGIGAKLALDRNYDTAGALFANRQAQDQANQLMSNANMMGQIAQQQSQNQFGNLANRATNMSIMAGGPASSLTAAMNAIGEQGSQSASNLLGTQGSQIANAIAQSSGILNNANQQYMASRGQQFDIFGKPYLNNWDKDNSSAAVLGQGLNASLDAQQAANNPLAGFALGGGEIGGRVLSKGLRGI